MDCALAFDLGGTSAKIALVSASGAVLAQEVVPTPASPDPLVVLRPFANAGDRLLAIASERSLRVSAVGCGVPGNMDPTRSRVLLNNIRALDGFDLAHAHVDVEAGVEVQADFRLRSAEGTAACEHVLGQIGEFVQRAFGRMRMGEFSAHGLS